VGVDDTERLQRGNRWGRARHCGDRLLVFAALLLGLFIVIFVFGELGGHE
jgi:hypothetical protein